jgi:hypothetical protein
VVPLRHYDVDTSIEIVLWIQKKNQAAYLSHRKKRIKASMKSP